MSFSIWMCFLPSNKRRTVLSGKALKRGARGSVCSTVVGVRERLLRDERDLERGSESESELEEDEEEEEEEGDEGDDDLLCLLLFLLFLLFLSSSLSDEWRLSLFLLLLLDLLL